MPINPPSEVLMQIKKLLQANGTSYVCAIKDGRDGHVFISMEGPVDGMAGIMCILKKIKESMQQETWWYLKGALIKTIEKDL